MPVYVAAIVYPTEPVVRRGLLVVYPRGLQTLMTPLTCQLPEVRDALPHHLHRFQVLVECWAVQPPLPGVVSGRFVEQRRTDGKSSAESCKTCRFALSTHIPQDLAT